MRRYAAPSRGLSREPLLSLQLPPTPNPGRRLPTHQPTRRPGGPLGARPSSEHRPARARSTHSWDPRQGARTRHGQRHLRALPPAGLAAAAAPARSPRRGPAPRRPAPAPRPPPPLPALRGAPHCRLRLPHWGSLSPRTRRSLRQLNHSPAAQPGGQGRGRGAAPLAAPRVGEPRLGCAGRGVGALSPHLRCPCALRPAWCWAEEAGRGRKRTAVGKGRPAQPPAQVPVFETNRSHGATPARGPASSCGQRGAQAS